MLFGRLLRARKTRAKAAELKLLPVKLEEECEHPNVQPDSIICVDVDVDKDKKSIDKAIDCAHAVFAPRPGEEIRFIPQMFAVVNFRSLSPEQLTLVNDELIPAGASVYAYPANCNSFDEAITELRRELAEISVARAQSRAARQPTLANWRKRAAAKTATGGAALRRESSALVAEE